MVALGVVALGVAEWEPFWGVLAGEGPMTVGMGEKVTLPGERKLPTVRLPGDMGTVPDILAMLMPLVGDWKLVGGAGGRCMGLVCVPVEAQTSGAEFHGF